MARSPPGALTESMTTSLDFESPVHLKAVAAENQPAVTPALEDLYRGFERELLIPLWTEIGDLMPLHPRSKAVPHLWRWDSLRALAAQAGELVPVGRGGERRAIALANPGLNGRPFATPTLWAAIQYLMPGENAPEHRHTQHAFRFVLEGEGVWTVVGGDPVAMRRGDFLPQAGWNWHAHHNATEAPMAWIDGLDIPLQYITEAQFFEFGRDEISAAEQTTPERSRSERLWGYPGLRPGRRDGAARHAGQPAARLPLGADRPGARRPAGDREGGLRRHRRARPRRRPLHRPGERGGRAADDPRRVPPDRPRRARPPRSGDRVERLHGLRRLRHRHRRRQDLVGGPRRPVRRARPGSRSRPGRRRAPPTPTRGALDLFRFSDSPVFEALKLNRASVEGDGQ